MVGWGDCHSPMRNLQVEYLLHVQELLAIHKSELILAGASMQQRGEKLRAQCVGQRAALLQSRHELKQARKVLQFCYQSSLSSFLQKSIMNLSCRSTCMHLSCRSTCMHLSCRRACIISLTEEHESLLKKSMYLFTRAFRFRVQAFCNQ